MINLLRKKSRFMTGFKKIIRYNFKDVKDFYKGNF